MRRSTFLLPLLPALWACGDAGNDYVIIENFMARSPVLTCQVVASPEYMAVTELRVATDSTVLVLDRPSRRLVELDAGLRPVWEMTAPAVGPGALNEPVGVAVLGDTAIVVAEQQGFQLIVYSRTGALVRSAPMTFAPSAVSAMAGGDVLVTAMSFRDETETLAYRFDGDRFHPLPVPPRAYDDLLASGLGNSTLAESFADGTAIVVHRFLAPRAFRILADGGAESLAIPTPDATRDRIGFVPAGPITEDRVGELLVPASAITVDRFRGEVYLLTRTGGWLEDRPERALLRLDHRLELLESWTLDFLARHVAFLADPGVLLMVDNEDRFHACDIRQGNGHARAR